MTSINPATGETLEQFDELTGTELERKLALTSAGFLAQRASSFDERAAVLLAAADQRQ